VPEEHRADQWFGDHQQQTHSDASSGRGETLGWT
jgi:hypothetical protein